ncbi:MAG: transposase [Chloroflexota bacterium]|nr:transposase [Chloroflexota bacterium]
MTYPPRHPDAAGGSPEALGPPDHFYRHLEAKLDLSFVREWVKGCYAERGRPGIDPVVFFKLQLVMFFDGIRSERRLIDAASLNLAHRWYLGYRLDEPLPDHSSLTRIRQRLGVDIFARFFARVVDLCQEAGLVWGRELCFDATKVRDNAALDSLVPRLAARQGDAQLPASFGPASLFVDGPTSCSDGYVVCYTGGCTPDDCNLMIQGRIGPMDFHWSWGDVCCHPSNTDEQYWINRCNAEVAGCGGKCTSVDFTPCW